MTIDFASLIFMWLLPLTASSTLGSNLTLTTQEDSSLHPLLEVTTQPIVVAETDDETKQQSTKPPLQANGTTPFESFLPNVQASATPTNPVSSHSSTAGINSTAEAATSTTMVRTSQAAFPATTASAPPILRISTQSQETPKTMTPQSTSDKTIHPSTLPTQSPIITNATTSTKAVENKSTSTVTGGDAMLSTGAHTTSLVTTRRTLIPSTKAKKKHDPPQKTNEPKNGTNHGKAVAGVIGGALALMMVGFLVIYLKKRKLRRQQITTSEWAGPSPFLDGGADNGEVTMRSSNRISLSSFLPQRLSKRLSLLPETDEELEDLTPGTTFGDKHQESTPTREVDGKGVKESNGTAVVVQETNTPGDAPETVENSVSVSSSQTDNLQSTSNISEVTNLSEDHPVNPPAPSGDEENALVQVNDGLVQP